MITNATRRFVYFVAAAMLAAGFSSVPVPAQYRPAPGDKEVARQADKGRAGVPLVRVTPHASVEQLPALPSMSGRRFVSGGVAKTPPPAALPPGDRARLLRESGIEINTSAAPREFRLSPRQPFVSTSAYLLFGGEVEFNAAADSLLLRATPGQGQWSVGAEVRRAFDTWGGVWGPRTAGPQPDPPSVVSVLVRMEPRSRYIADFSVSADLPTSYRLRATGAEGSGSFAREAGGQHILVALESAAGGYVRLDLSSGVPFTFHNVAVTKLD